MPEPDPVSLEAQSTYRVYYLAYPFVDLEFSFPLTLAAFTALALLVVPVTLAVLE